MALYNKEKERLYVVCHCMSRHILSHFLQKFWTKIRIFKRSVIHFMPLVYYSKECVMYFDYIFSFRSRNSHTISKIYDVAINIHIHHTCILTWFSQSLDVNHSFNNVPRMYMSLNVWRFHRMSLLPRAIRKWW